MNRRTADDLIDGALEPLPRIRVEFDPLLLGRGRLGRLLLHVPIITQIAASERFSEAVRCATKKEGAPTAMAKSQPEQPSGHD